MSEKNITFRLKNERKSNRRIYKRGKACFMSKNGKGEQQ